MSLLTGCRPKLSSELPVILGNRAVADFYSVWAAGIPSRADLSLPTIWPAENLTDCCRMPAGSRWPSIGVWALSPGNVSPNNSDAAAAPAAEMYFTAGPNHGSGGLFGYLTAVSTELTEGNA